MCVCVQIVPGFVINLCIYSICTVIARSNVMIKYLIGWVVGIPVVVLVIIFLIFR